MSKGREYLRKICFIALSSNADISFVAVVDDRGKLIVGQSRGGNMINGQKNLSINTHYPVSNLFYLNYLIPSIRKGIVAADVHLQDNSTKMQFELMHIADDNKIAISPLTGSKGKYLCVYFSRNFS
ncbi:MAG TPA: hypothetical protein VFI73_02650 [Candidatus Nitrosopolaris sp.]|nr:hypothetical protein [Candidatus Nitrosopolaris sp.]